MSCRRFKAHQVRGSEEVILWSFSMNSEAQWTFAFIASKSLSVPLKELYGGFASKIYNNSVGLETSSHTRLSPARRVPSHAHVHAHTHLCTHMHTHACTHTCVNTGRWVGRQAPIRSHSLEAGFRARLWGRWPGCRGGRLCLPERVIDFVIKTLCLEGVVTCPLSVNSHMTHGEQAPVFTFSHPSSP